MYLYLFFKSSFVYVFDGLPRFLANGVVHSDDNLIGAFCGTTRSQPITVEATSGVFPYFYLYEQCFVMFFCLFVSLAFISCDLTIAGFHYYPLQIRHIYLYWILLLLLLYIIVFMETALFFQKFQCHTTANQSQVVLLLWTNKTNFI